jgi:hypothetical protein
VRAIPGYFSVGLADNEFNVRTYRDAEAYYKKAGLPGTFSFLEKRGHELVPEEMTKAAAMFETAKRARYPKAFKALFYRYDDDPRGESVEKRQYWLEAVQGPAGTACDVKVTGNVIEITADDFTKGSVLLNDEIVSLDADVVVRVNGKEVFNGRVERSVEFLIERWKIFHDRGQLYWNRVELGL